MSELVNCLIALGRFRPRSPLNEALKQSLIVFPMQFPMVLAFSDSK